MTLGDIAWQCPFKLGESQGAALILKDGFDLLVFRGFLILSAVDCANKARRKIENVHNQQGFFPDMKKLKL